MPKTKLDLAVNDQTASSYRVQHTDNGKSWRELSFGRRNHPTAAAAWDQARSYDEDGFLTPAYRVVDQNGKAVERPAR